MPNVKCSITGCNFSTGENDAAIVVELLKLHALGHAATAPAPDANRQKPPKLNRPTIVKGLSEEEWNTVSKKWEIFKSSTNIPAAQVSTQLWQCCDEELTSELFRDVPDISTISEDNLLKSIKQLAVLSVAACVRKTELFSMRQDRGQPIRSFAANVRGKAHTCSFSKKCGTPTCASPVDYTDDIVKYVLLAGVADEEIKRDVLGLGSDLDLKSLNDTISLIESKEMAARAMSSTPNGAGHVAAALNNTPTPQKHNASGDIRNKLALRTNCKKCQTSMPKFVQFRMKSGSSKLREFELCKDCWKKENKDSVKDTTKNSPVVTGAIFDQLSALHDSIDADDSSPDTTSSDSLMNFVTNWDELLAKSKASIDSAISLLSSSSAAIEKGCMDLLQESSSLTQRLSDQLAQVVESVSGSPCETQSSPIIEEQQHPIAFNRGAQVNSSPPDEMSDPPCLGQSTIATMSDVILDHHIFDGTGGWRRSESRAQPSLQLDLSVNPSDYGHLGVPCPPTKPSSSLVITDTGAQSSLMGYKIFRRCGFKDRDLIPVTRRMVAANNEGIRILGAILLRISGKDSLGNTIETAEMVYVSDSTDNFYLSRHAMEQLGIIGPEFPSVGSAMPTSTETAIHSVAQKEDSSQFNRAECGCFVRTCPPSRPSELPFAPVKENIPAMKDWLMNHFSASVFNKCPHQKLPLMDGPPLEVHINESAEGDNTACHTPAMTPLHWYDDAKRILNDFCNLGIIEKVGLDEETKWCHRGFWTRKADGSPRLVVDLQKLNKHCARSMHHTVPPFQQARRIPAHTYRTVIDAWNGYYSVPLREEDRHLFTFSTEFGLFRFCVAPQGFVGSGDGYTDRYDRIIVDTPRKTKVVDDTALWDDALEEHWWRIIDHLELLGRSGITLNPEKFQFCQREIDFAGFRVTETEVKPLPKYLNAIRDFPRPKNIKDIRAWFGLINQVSHYGRLTEIMAPFKPLLSPKTRFFWSDELEHAFQESKIQLVEAIQHGVQIFDPKLPTCLTPDWSKKGIGYWLRQKYCDCSSEVPGCCEDGWKITLVGSRFLKDAEHNYAPVEGEALAIAWALMDTKYFTLGCDNLVIASDHRPHKKIFGDKPLDEFTSERLFNLRRRTSKWRFKVVHVPGKSIPASDAASRYPSDNGHGSPEVLDSDSDLDFLAAVRVDCDDEHLEDMIVASAKAALNNVKAVTWERVKQETQSDEHMAKLVELVIGGFPNSITDLPIPLQPYWNQRDKLSVVDGVIMREHRVVIPPTLRKEVSDSLHSAHQGVTGMGNRARASVFWPGISTSIQDTRELCTPCDRMAPSQPFQTPVPPTVPTMPFEAIAADYFTLGGYYYLVSVDRFSNWPELKQIKRTEENTGTAGLIKALKHLFAGFGVPVELSSDGGPEFK